MDSLFSAAHQEYLSNIQDDTKTYQSYLDTLVSSNRQTHSSSQE